MPDEMTPEEIQAVIAERDALKAANAKQAHETWKTKALDAFALAKELPDLVSGDTEADYLASAKQLHEKIEAMLQKAVEKAKPEVEKAAAREAYGAPAAGGGGKPPEHKDHLQSMTDEVQNYLTGQGPRPTKETLDHFVTQWGQRAIVNRIANPTK